MIHISKVNNLILCVKIIMSTNQYRAVCVLTNNNPGIKGFVEFTELPNKKVRVNVNISGLTPGYHGFHIHQRGDLREGCKSLCSHFNPFNTPHGNPHSGKTHRHVGDLGNIFADSEGVASECFIDQQIKLRGKCNIVGRSVVVHEKEDDLGFGGIDESGNIYDHDLHQESLKTGNAGSRIACGVIGWA